ncbi:DUF418 domain-containing protein [Lederbergia sp. NSJ-179]|uniref:DUF418 domain-containing protein n=1 Tax=Lederbergia sp. NSJ-179 TaxID=2931402 RepID=UPI001FD074A1|nr:DUF418 domain-containing protein [Lederbergia sp. NSJ-179]MCJ7840380.1 DUF418 domain-containing protein [Lederbergia sp. NSJ-179]
MMENKLGPTLSRDRIQSLDSLRGFSLLGIFIVNMLSFHSPFSYYNPYEWWKYEDLTAYMWIDILVQASFYPIFAMMFGYGMVLMQERFRLKNSSFWKISVRRLLVLLGFGVVHAFLIWHGDILITYALMGLLLLPLLRLSGTLLLSIGAAVYLLPQLFMSFIMIMVSIIDTSTLGEFTDIMNLQQSAEIYVNGTFWEITKQRFLDWYMANGPANFILVIFMILPLMMVGAGAAKLKWLEKAKHHKKAWLIVFFVFLSLGLAGKILPLVLGQSISNQYVQDMIGGPLLSVAYIALIVFLMSNPYIAKIGRPLANAGRMSITIYLSQSVIGTLIFYSYGLGLYGQMSVAAGTWLAIGIFVFQIIFAEIWLSKFNQGPVEKLWRFFTYGRKKDHKRGLD